MRVGYQGEPESYSHMAAGELFADAERVGFSTFPACFSALGSGTVDTLVLPIENSTTGSVLPVLDRLIGDDLRIVAEHMVEVQHALLAVPGASLDDIERVSSHPEALSQAQGALSRYGWEPMPAHDTAGAVRLVAERGDKREAALGRPSAATAHGLTVLLENVVDRDHNTTRFVVLEPGKPDIAPDADKTSIAFETLHRPGALALALTELGLRGANLTRIESRPGEEAWRYRMFVDLIHTPGQAGFDAVLDPPPITLAALHHLGTYRAYSGPGS